METRPLKARLWLTSPALVLVLGAGCSPALENRQPAVADDDLDLAPAQAKLRFPSKDLAGKHRAALAAPKSFDPVFDYARSVTVFCQASLVDTTCNACQEGEVRYKPRSDLDPHYWPIIEDVLAMLEPMMDTAGLDAAQMEQLTATKGRLLWLAGRSSEEENLIDAYARAHPDAVSVVKRRLELLRDSGDNYGSESQCTRSRAKLKAAPEATRLELLTSCVALHPSNGGGKSDPEDFTRFLPNAAPDEDALYRTHLVQRCVEDLGDSESRCSEACGCMAEQPTANCKRACRDCRSEAEQQIRGCKTLAAPAPAPAASPARARAPRPKVAPAPLPASAPRPRTPPAPRPREDDGSGPQQAVL